MVLDVKPLVPLISTSMPIVLSVNVQKNVLKTEFDQRLECAAPKNWSKYTIT